MFAVWLFICAFAAVLLELSFGRHGLIVPWFTVCVFYFSVLGDWRRHAPLLLLLGALLDFSFGRHIPCRLFVLAAVIPLAHSWRRHGDCIHRGAQAVPGFFAGAINGALALMLVRFPTTGIGRAYWWEYGWIFLQYALGGALALPVLAASLDRLAERLDLPRYHAIQKIVG